MDDAHKTANLVDVVERRQRNIVELMANCQARDKMVATLEEELKKVRDELGVAKDEADKANLSLSRRVTSLKLTWRKLESRRLKTSRSPMSLLP